MTYKPYYMKDVLDNSNKELFNVISTFAGGGGSSTGYRLAVETNGVGQSKRKWC